MLFCFCGSMPSRRASATIVEISAIYWWNSVEYASRKNKNKQKFEPSEIAWIIHSLTVGEVISLENHTWTAKHFFWDDGGKDNAFIHYSLPAAPHLTRPIPSGLGLNVNNTVTSQTPPGCEVVGGKISPHKSIHSWGDESWAIEGIWRRTLYEQILIFWFCFAKNYF